MVTPPKNSKPPCLGGAWAVKFDDSQKWAIVAQPLWDQTNPSGVLLGAVNRSAATVASAYEKSIVRQKQSTQSGGAVAAVACQLLPFRSLTCCSTSASVERIRSNGCGSDMYMSRMA